MTMLMNSICAAVAIPAARNPPKASLKDLEWQAMQTRNGLFDFLSSLILTRRRTITIALSGFSGRDLSAHKNR